MVLDFDPFGPEHRKRFKAVPADAIRWLIGENEEHGGVLKPPMAVMLKLAEADPSVLSLEVFYECVGQLLACDRQYDTYKTAFKTEGYFTGLKKVNTALLPNTKDTMWMRAMFEKYGQYPPTEKQHAEFMAKIKSKEWTTLCAPKASTSDAFFHREMSRLIDMKREAEDQLKKRKAEDQAGTPAKRNPNGRLDTTRIPNSMRT